MVNNHKEEAMEGVAEAIQQANLVMEVGPVVTQEDQI